MNDDENQANLMFMRVVAEQIFKQHLWFDTSMFGAH